MRAGIAADRTRANDSYLPTHAFLPGFLAAEASASVGSITTVERVWQSRIAKNKIEAWKLTVLKPCRFRGRQPDRVKLARMYNQSEIDQ
jgi:hypothetical protein